MKLRRLFVLPDHVFCFWKLRRDDHFSIGYQGQMEDPNKRPRIEGDPEQGIESTEKKVRTHQKKKVAVLFGYRGFGYHGSAKSGNELPTIERDVEKALLESKVIDGKSELTKIGFSRASRTDKGVSALINCFGAKLYFSKEELEDHSTWVERVNSFLPPNIRVWNVYRVRGSFNAKDATCSRTYDYVAPLSCFKPKGADDWHLDLEQLNAALLQFVGTNNFHNYTNGKNYESNDVKRVIWNFKALKTMDIAGSTFVHFRIKGQSFMLHQIRKIMCMVICTSRDGHLFSPRARKIILGSFGREHINIPKAPAVGLFLKEAHFELYNKHWGTGEGRERIELRTEEQARVEAFAQEFVWPDIANETQEFLEFLEAIEEYPLDYDQLMKVADIIEKIREEKKLKFGTSKVAISHFDE